MAIKVYCDKCGEETEDYREVSVVVENPAEVETVETASQELCTYCTAELLIDLRAFGFKVPQLKAG